MWGTEYFGATMTEHTAIGLDEARATGLKRYFTGIPCRNGHICERRVSTRACVECQNKIVRTRIKNNNKNRQMAVAQLKADAKCSRCGFGHPAALHYHHYKGGKMGKVANMVRRSSSMVGVLAEIAKCVVLCANCHAIEHWNQHRAVQ